MQCSDLSRKIYENCIPIRDELKLNVWIVIVRYIIGGKLIVGYRFWTEISFFQVALSHFRFTTVNKNRTL